MKFTDLLKKTAAYLAQAARDAQNWYNQRIAGIGSGGNQQPPNSPPPGQGPFKRTSIPEIGKMYIYYYDPKWKHILPYYDQYPLVFPIDYYHDGFLGINLHYLPPLARVALLQALYDLFEDENISQQQRLRISYGILKASATKYIGFENCVKRYLYGHVRSSFHEIDRVDWERVAVLPLQRWITNPNRNFARNPPY